MSEQAIRSVDKYNNTAITVCNLKLGLDDLSIFEGNIDKINEIFYVKRIFNVKCH